MNILQSYPLVLLALMIWREARGQSFQAKIAIAHVVNNRLRDPKGPYKNCHTLIETVTKFAQFSSMTIPGDPNLVKWPLESDLSFQECCSAVQDMIQSTSDPTNGCNYYHSYPPGDPRTPAWDTENTFKLQIGPFRFCKL